jgi:phosphoribosylformylglycinamidine cyclo-ligase
MIHCSGGGQTKCMKYLPGNMRIVKNNLFDAPPIFKLIQANSGANTKEMYQVFNMGHRLEIFTDAASAEFKTWFTRVNWGGTQNGKESLY